MNTPPALPSWAIAAWEALWSQSLPRRRQPPPPTHPHTLTSMRHITMMSPNKAISRRRYQDTRNADIMVRLKRKQTRPPSLLGQLTSSKMEPTFADTSNTLAELRAIVGGWKRVNRCVSKSGKQQISQCPPEPLIQYSSHDLSRAASCWPQTLVNPCELLFWRHGSLCSYGVAGWKVIDAVVYKRLAREGKCETSDFLQRYTKSRWTQTRKWLINLKVHTAM